jgi:Rod binding domain-containing protein
VEHRVVTVTALHGERVLELSAEEVLQRPCLVVCRRRGGSDLLSQCADLLGQVAGQFEAILVRQLLGPTMNSMLGKEGGAASNVYGDMLTDTFAQQLTSGGGMGLSRLLEKQLAPRAPRADLNSSADPADSL